MAGTGVVRNSISNNSGSTQFAKDPQTLEKLSELMMSNSNFRQAKENTWEQELNDILAANNDLRCGTCGNSGVERIPLMDELLDNLEYISQFEAKPGIETVYSGLRSNINNRDAVNHMIDYMKRYPNEFTNLTEFEFRYADDILNRADVLVENTLYEFKSWTPDNPNPWNSFFTGSGNSYTQFLRYLKNTNDLNELKYIFNAQKSDIGQVKEAFRGLFLDKADDWFKPIDDGGLGIVKVKQLFGDDIEDVSDFIEYADDLDSEVYSFLKAD
ncbi:hypothetical protein MATR_21180 [Marivirga tractuosa]|uniref:Uncharacterized protein n=2 Tax=Marivirga TaxID=869806 RepID=E4TLX4_MARTH|nr:hypothetical protein Ftrac_0256 [Marivirga tractuosa DSM 4126]BDD15293.1 hypothetical protein MATR_21180 [Marivirga tractuosa]